MRSFCLCSIYESFETLNSQPNSEYNFDSEENTRMQKKIIMQDYEISNKSIQDA